MNDCTGWSKKRKAVEWEFPFNFFPFFGPPGNNFKNAVVEHLSLKCIRLHVYEVTLSLNNRFETTTGSKSGNHSPSGNSETKKGYSDPCFKNFPTYFLVGV